MLTPDEQGREAGPARQPLNERRQHVAVICERKIAS